MATKTSRSELERIYAESAQIAFARGALEKFGETVSQARQRAITLASLDVLRTYNPAVHVFNDLLVRDSPADGRPSTKFVPDNMLVLHAGPIKADECFDVGEQLVGPLWVLDYGCEETLRKRYEENRASCEKMLKVPYYLTFQPEVRKLSLYRHSGRKYVSVKPNEHGRYAVPDLEMEVALLDEWTRFWFRGELLPLPADLVRELAERDRQLSEQGRQLADERQARLAAEEELTRLRAEMHRLKNGSRNNR